MKILISALDAKKNSKVDMKFGRAEYFAIFDTKTGEYDFIENEAKNGAHGAGPVAAQKTIDLNVDIVLTGNLGIKAKSVIDQTKIKVYRLDKEKVNENVEAYLNNNLKEIKSAGPSNVGK